MRTVWVPAILLAALSLPATAQPSVPVVAVYPLDYPADQPLADALWPLLEEAVAATGKFTVTPRSDLASRMREAARSGERTALPNADHMLYGEMRQTGCDSLIEQDRLTAWLRLTQVATGRIVHSLRVDFVDQDGDICRDVPSRRAVLQRAASQWATRLATDLFPITVTAVGADRTLTINYGTGSLFPGDRFQIFIATEPIRDPVTGDILDDGEQRWGEVEIERVERFQAVTRPVERDRPLPAVGSRLLAGER